MTKETNKEAAGAVDRAMINLIFTHPFFSTLALRLRVVEATHISGMTKDGTVATVPLPTMGVDGRHLFYNPEFVLGLEKEELIGVVCHEVIHCASKHHLRRNDRDPKLWNVATDYVVNGTVQESGFTLPEGGLINPQYAAMSEEAVYALLEQDLPNNPELQKLLQPGDGGDGGDGSDPGKCGGVLSPRDEDGNEASLSQAELAAEARNWDMAVVQAAKVAKARGNCPAFAERLVQELTEPKANFHQLLQRFMDRQCKNDYSWFPPNRRHVGAGLYLPSVSGEGLGPVVVAVDTSGSMSDDDISVAAGAINAVLRDAHPEVVHVVYVDAKTAHAETFAEEDLPLTIHPKGGGGTRFTPAFDWVAEQHLDPSCMIYITDMYSNDFPTTAPYPVLWARTKGHADTVPPFGTTVDLT